MNALSIDVEEYYHATIFQEAVNGVTTGLESRVEASTERVLALLAAHDVRATFFVLGEVGSGHPAIVRKIAGAGHEVACHGYHHDLVFGQSPETFRAGIRRAKAVLEDVGGQPVVGYRAPSFSIGPEERWAYAILAEEGFRYDSSVYPIVHDRYGDREAPRFPYEIWRSGSDSLIEFPIGTVRLFGVNLPVGGGGYFRLLPGPRLHGRHPARQHARAEAPHVLLPSLGARSRAAATADGLAPPLPPLRRPGAARSQAGAPAVPHAVRHRARGSGADGG